jgi:tetratricopeptide (TPR) repeat protein
MRRELGDQRGIATSLNCLGYVADQQGNHEAARTLNEESLAIRRELGDRRGIAVSLICLGDIACLQDDYGAAHTLYEEGLEISRELGDRWGLANSLYGLGNMAYRQGDYDAVRTLLQESLTFYREMGHPYIIHALSLLGHVEQEMGDYAQATTLHQESLRLRREQGDVLTTASSLEDFAGLAVRQGQWERAVRLLGAAEALCATLGRALPVGMATEYERTVAAAWTALDAEAFGAAGEEGRAMTLEQAVAYALKEDESVLENTASTRF